MTTSDYILRGLFVQFEIHGEWFKILKCKIVGLKLYEGGIYVLFIIIFMMAGHIVDAQ